MGRLSVRRETGDRAVQDAFNRAYRQHLAAIVRYLRRRLGDDAAEDAAAEVFARAYAKFSAFEDRGLGPLPWLYGIASHVVAERWRDEQRRREAIARLGDGLGAWATGDERDDGSRDVDPVIIRALDLLSDADRETLLLFAWGELSYAELAMSLDVPVGTVRSRLARARSTLTDALSADGHSRVRDVT